MPVGAPMSCGRRPAVASVTRGRARQGSARQEGIDLVAGRQRRLGPGPQGGGRADADRPTSGVDEVGIVHPTRALRRNQQSIMDGYGWQPLTQTWDYTAARRRILDEVFPEEAKATGIA